MTINSNGYKNPHDLFKADRHVRHEINFKDGSEMFGLLHKCEACAPFWIHRSHGRLGDVDGAKVLDETRLNEVLELVAPELDAVVASHEAEWDGKNMRSYVNKEALEALDAAIIDALAQIDHRELCDVAVVWEMAQRFNEVNFCAKYGLSATTSDDELLAIRERIQDETASDNIRLYRLDDVLWCARSLLQEKNARPRRADRRLGTQNRSRRSKKR